MPRAKAKPKGFSAKADLGHLANEPRSLGQFAAHDTGYDATEATTRRRAPKNVVKSEDGHLGTAGRKTLVATTRDIRRNFSVFRWALNKHLDFVAEHNFRSRSGDRDFDRRLEKFVDRLSAPDMFDVKGRFDRQTWVRNAEACSVVDGDFLAVKIFGGYLQGIEGDRIKDPPFDMRKTADEKWVHGCLLNDDGAVERYSVYKRIGNGNFAFERILKSGRAYLHGYFDRFDQARGISPVASAVNTLVGLYQGFDYALAKSMVAQLLAFAIYRNADRALGSGFEDDDYEPTEYKVDFGKGPAVLDMDPGDKAEMLSVNTPGGETAAFWQTLISVSLKALDIPYSWFDEDYATFFGNRAAIMLYQKGARTKQLRNERLLNWWLTWRLKLAIETGEFQVPVGYEVDPYWWSWTPTGLQWWNPAQEASAAEKSIQLKLRSRTEIRKETHGDDWRDVVDELAEEELYLASKLQANQAQAPEVTNGNQ